jgi:hypothetical protein
MSITGQLPNLSFLFDSLYAKGFLFDRENLIHFGVVLINLGILSGFFNNHQYYLSLN